MAKPKNVDDYLARLEGNFAHPILSRVRGLVHRCAPEAEEKIKWGAPSFEHKGLMVSMVAFKKFAAVWFHKGSLLKDPKKLLEASSEDTKAMRKYLIARLEDLDEEGFCDLIRQAASLNDEGRQVEGLGKKKTLAKRSAMLDQALAQNSRLRDNYQALSEAKKIEYAEYIEAAKRQDTRQRRLEKSLELIGRGEGLHDRYK